LTSEQIAAAEAFIAAGNLGANPDITMDNAGRATYSFLNGTRFIVDRDGGISFSSIAGASGQGTGTVARDDLSGG
jgi:hypothetical protein